MRRPGKQSSGDAVGWVPVIVAIVGAGGPLMFLLHRLDQRNSTQHAQSIGVQQQTLAQVKAARQDINRLEKRVDRHLEWHSEEATD